MNQQQTTHASIQLLPIGGNLHPYTWVDEIINLIAGSGIPYTVGPFGTVVEGSYADIYQLLHTINMQLQQQECPEWVLQVQWHMRSNGPATAAAKTLNRAGNYPNA